MISTEIKDGQGLGNQLFCYVTTRATALRNGVDFSITGTDWLGDKRFNSKGIFWMDLDFGQSADNTWLPKYEEKCQRYFTNTCNHDTTIGCDVRTIDKDILTLKCAYLSGIMQSEEYFSDFRPQVNSWLKVLPEFDIKDFSNEDTCVINFRGGEYVFHPAMFLNKKYWENAITNMLKINSKMKFVVVTDDPYTARKFFPNTQIFYGDIAGHYAVIKNAYYAILSNSSFAFFPIFTSTTIKYLIAPKYWSRHNVSDGYWSTEQNLYRGWNYQDREGSIFNYYQCKEELERYKVETDFNSRIKSV